MGQFKFILWLAYWYLQAKSFEFEWDTGNSMKSIQKHGVTQDEVESVFELKLGVPIGCQVSPPVEEERLCIVGPFSNGRMISVVFTLREGRVRLEKRSVDFMKKYAKRLKEYDRIDFDPKEIIAGMSRLKGARRKPTSIALEEELLVELKSLAAKKGVPYQVLTRLLIADGIRRMKKAA